MQLLQSPASPFVRKVLVTLHETGQLDDVDMVDIATTPIAPDPALISANPLGKIPALMRSEEMTEVYGYRSAAEMLALDNPPTGFLVSSMITAIGVRRAIHEAGLEMGRDVSVITHDDDLGYLRNGHDVPIFTATRSSVRLAGMRAAEMLLDLIRNPARAPLTQLMEAELIIGSSTGPAQ